MAAASLLASATGSGICRVDWLDGRWVRGRVPYCSVEAIRGEVGVEEGEEADEDADDFEEVKGESIK